MLRSEKDMSKNLERSAATRPVYREASYIIGQNKGIRLSEEILLQLRRAGLRLIPQPRPET